MRDSEPTVLDWAVAARAHPDESESGDRHVVAPFASGVLIGAVDGLGHGTAAAAAAATAAEVLGEHRVEEPIALVRRCHAALAATRGVVMSLASIDAVAATATWLGVGNVGCTLVRGDPAARPRQQALLLRSGVVGYRLPELDASVLAIRPGDTFVFATDGVGAACDACLVPGDSAARMAERILREHARASDDALVLVARFRGLAA